MKIVYLLSIIIFLTSCKCKKNAIDDLLKVDATAVAIAKKPIVSNCPENGKCTTQIFRNKSLDIKADEFGAIYYNQIDNPETSVIVYSYNKNVPKGLQDGNYREDIVFEIKNSDKKLALQNENLQNVKMLFGRFCFCRGQTGNYKIVDGNLNLTQNNNEVQFDLEFKNNKVPQIILAITETVKF